MNGILATAELLSSMKLDSSQKECLDIILGSSQDLLSIVNSLLDLAKFREGKIKIDKFASLTLLLSFVFVSLGKDNTMT